MIINSQVIPSLARSHAPVSPDLADSTIQVLPAALLHVPQRLPTEVAPLTASDTAREASLLYSLAVVSDGASTPSADTPQLPAGLWQIEYSFYAHFYAANAAAPVPFLGDVQVRLYRGTVFQHVGEFIAPTAGVSLNLHITKTLTLNMTAPWFFRVVHGRVFTSGAVLGRLLLNASRLL